MSWKAEVEGIEERRRLAQELGGKKAVARQHAKGRLTIRERIEGLLDPASFREQGPLAGQSELDESGRLVGFKPANYVLGVGELDGRPCVVGGEDFTQSGGSPSPAGLRKSVYAETLAVRMRLPLVRFLEGAGGSVAGPGKGRGAGGGARPTPPAGEPVFAPPRFRSVMQVMAQSPVVSAAVGAVAGLPASRLAASHFSVMTKSSQVLIGGPALVARAMGEDKSKEELGGPKVHLRSGVVDNLAEDEEAAFALVRRFLGYLPSNVWQLPPVATSDDDPERTEEALLDIIPRDRRKIYDARKIVEAVVDRGSFFEMTAPSK